MTMNVIKELIPFIGVCLLVLSLCFVAAWRLYKAFASRGFMHKTHLGRLNAMLKNSPYPVVFRTKDCKAYNKCNCHIAVDENTGSEVLIIDLE